MAIRGLKVALVALVAAVAIGAAGHEAAGDYDIETTGSVWPSHAADGDWRVVDPSSSEDAEFYVGQAFQQAAAVDVTNGATLTTPERVWLACTVAATATVRVNGAAWVAEDHVGVGNGALTRAAIEVTDGTWSVAGSCYVGADSNSSGAVRLAGTAQWTSEFQVHVGHYGAGEVNVGANASWVSEDRVNVGFFANSTGTVNLNGGDWTSQGTLQVGHLAGGAVHVNAGSTLICAGRLDLTDVGELALDGGLLRLAGGAGLLGDVGAGAGGGTLRVEVGSATPDADLCVLGQPVDLTGCTVEAAFEAGFTPGASDSFNLFDPAGGADLSALLSAADSITTPVDWRLDLPTGVMTYVPEPAGVALLLAGAWAVLRRRRAAGRADGRDTCRQDDGETS